MEQALGRMFSNRRLTVLAALLGLILIVAGIARWNMARTPEPVSVPGMSTREVVDLVQKVSAIEARERQVNETTWRAELLAQRCGRSIDELWDELNQSTNGQCDHISNRPAW